LELYEAIGSRSRTQKDFPAGMESQFAEAIVGSRSRRRQVRRKRRRAVAVIPADRRELALVGAPATQAPAISPQLLNTTPPEHHPREQCAPELDDTPCGNSNAIAKSATGRTDRRDTPGALQTFGVTGGNATRVRTEPVLRIPETVDEG
jgi:hypothetical protein